MISRKENHGKETTSSLKPAITGKLTVKQAIEMASKIKNKQCLSWYDKLDEKKRSWCDELKKEYKSGSCVHVPINSLRVVVNETLSVSVSEQSFRVWLKDIYRPKRDRR